MRARLVSRVAVVCLAGLVSLAACNQTPKPPQRPLVQSAEGPRPTPAPPFRSIDSASFTAVMHYVDSLAFNDAAGGTTHVAGTAVAWAPEIGAGGIVDSGLARGRIISRVQTSGTLAAFGSRASAGYVWVDSGPAGWRGMLLPTDSSIARTHLAMAFGSRRFPDDHKAEVRVVADSILNHRCGTRCCITVALGVEITPALIARVTDIVHH